MHCFAVDTLTLEGEVVAHNLVTTLHDGLVTDPLVMGKVNIVDLTTGLTLEMGMGLGICVIALHREGHTGDCPFIRQQIEIAVDGAQT